MIMYFQLSKSPHCHLRPHSMAVGRRGVRLRHLASAWELENSSLVAAEFSSGIAAAPNPSRDSTEEFAGATTTTSNRAMWTIANVRHDNSFGSPWHKSSEYLLTLWGEVSLCSWTPVLLVCIQLLCYVKIIRENTWLVECKQEVS